MAQSYTDAAIADAAALQTALKESRPDGAATFDSGRRPKLLLAHCQP